MGQVYFPRKLDHSIEIIPAYDCIHYKCKFDSNRCHPGEGRSHGIHSVKMRFISKGPEGAIVFILYTGWGIDGRQCQSIPADLGYHSKTPMWEGDQFTSHECVYCDNLPCYYSGSELNARDVMRALENGGDIGIWKFLDEYYEYIFLNGEYPTPMKYPTPRRGR